MSKKKSKKNQPLRGTKRVHYAIGTAAIVGVVVATGTQLLGVLNADSSNDAEVTPVEHVILPNGGGERLAVSPDTWREDLHALYPNATRIGLWTGEGELVGFTSYCMDRSDECVRWAANGECERNPPYMQSECVASCGVCRRGRSSSSESLPAASPLYAVLDHYPFVWPAEPGRVVRVYVPGSDSPLTLHALSLSPRVLEVEVASAEECAAMIRVSHPVLEASVTFEGGSQMATRARTSASGWLQLPPPDATGDAAVLRAVWLRLAALARMHPLATENMQAISCARGRTAPRPTK